MHTNCLLFASCNKLLNNSTFYHLNCPANRDDTPIPPSSFAPVIVLSTVQNYFVIEPKNSMKQIALDMVK